MKTLILIPSVGLIVLLSSFSSGYETIMKENIEKVYKAESIEELNNVVNAFNRIAQKEQNKWEPYYYASFGYLLMLNTTKKADEQDKYLDLALEKSKQALELVANEDEIHALIGYIHMMRVSINPSDRGQKYSMLSMESLNKAIALDSENPRALYLLGRMEMGIAQFFGSDMSDACGKIQNSLTLFDKENTESTIAPTWGAKQARKVAEYCKK